MTNLTEDERVTKVLDDRSEVEAGTVFAIFNHGGIIAIEAAATKVEFVWKKFNENFRGTDREKVTFVTAGEATTTA